jgi:hypothetical protein
VTNFCVKKRQVFGFYRLNKNDFLHWYSILSILVYFLHWDFIKSSVYTGFCLSRVWFIHDSVYSGFGLYGILLIQGLVYTDFVYSGFGLYRILFIQGLVYTWFCLFRVWFIQDSVYSGFGLYRILFIQGLVLTGFTVIVITDFFLSIYYKTYILWV